MIPSQELVHQGLSWTAALISGQAPILGLGGVGREVNMGELWIESLAFPSMVTLTLGLSNMNPAFPAFGVGAIQARVSYGVGAANETLLMDWGTQNSICLPAGKLNVTAVEVGDPTTPFNIFVPVLLTAQIAAGPRSSLGWPTLTDVVTLVAGVPLVIYPPRRAKRLIVGDTRGQAASDVQVVLNARSGLNMWNLGNPSDSLIRTEGVIVPSATNIITLTSAAGTGANGLVICWLLDG